MTLAAQDRLIAAAERLFARRGIAAVSLREIGAAADHRNTSAVQYHFGSKRRLVDAVFVSRMRLVDERRLMRLEALERAGRTDELRALVEAMVWPFAESLKRGSHSARFLAQVVGDPVQGHLVRLDLDVMEGLRRITARLWTCMRGLPATVRAQRLLLVSNLMIHAFAEHERQLETGHGPITPTVALAADLVDMIAAMIGAPASETVLRSVRRVSAGSAGVRKMLGTTQRRSAYSRAISKARSAAP